MEYTCPLFKPVGPMHSLLPCFPSPVLDSLAIERLAENNRVAAKKWKEMSGEAISSTCSTGSSCDKWHETQRILSNMQDNVSH